MKFRRAWLKIEPTPSILTPVRNDKRIEEMAYKHGQVYDSYLACESNRNYFWSSDKSGMVSYVRVGKHLKVGGGLLASQADKPQLLREFLEYVTQNYKSAAFFNITDSDLPLFQRYGIQITKWGEDTLIDLVNWDCKGKEFEWLRRQKNFCSRHEITCHEWHPKKCSVDEFEATRTELELVEKDGLQLKPQAFEMRFFQGVLDFTNLGRKRVFIARSRSGTSRIEAFLVANPYQNGKSWAFEIFRHRHDSVRGVLPYLKLNAMELMKAEGVQQVSLCMIPGLNCQSVRSGDSRFVRRFAAWSSSYLNSLYDCSGLYHYKSRFRPQLVNRYICTYPRVSAGSFLTTAHLSGLAYVCPFKVTKLIWRHLVNRSRSTLPKLGKSSPQKNVSER